MQYVYYFYKLYSYLVRDTYGNYKMLSMPSANPTCISVWFCWNLSLFSSICLVFVFFSFLFLKLFVFIFSLPITELQPGLLTFLDRNRTLLLWTVPVEIPGECIYVLMQICTSVANIIIRHIIIERQIADPLFTVLSYYSCELFYEIIHQLHDSCEKLSS